jgi:hypothetical protein
LVSRHMWTAAGRALGLTAAAILSENSRKRRNTAQ